MPEPVRRRVALTGAGIVTAAVTGGAATLAACLAGDRARRAPVPEGDTRRLSSVCQLAVGATRLALADAGVTDATDFGFVVGTEFGDLRSTIDFADGYLRSGPGGLSALLFPNTVMNAMAAVTTIAVGARQLSLTLNVASVGGELAVARAAAAIAGGRVDGVIAGGVDEIDPRVGAALGALGVRRPRLADGAAFVVLEAWERAVARGATILGEVRAVAWRALHARSHGVGRGAAAEAIAAVLAAGARRPADIGAVYVSADGDDARDAWEARVLDRALAGAAPPRRALAPVLGAHAGRGAAAVAAAAWTARTGRVAAGPDVHGGVLVHGLARGGTHVALLVDAPGTA